MKKIGWIFRQCTALVCAVVMVQSQAALFAQALPVETQMQQPIQQPMQQMERQDSAPMPVPMEAGQAGQAAQMMAPAQLDSLVAPLALYPDPLLSQVLVASTYPLEIVEAEQWMQQNPNLSGAALADAAKQQNWDPSIQALVAFPDVLRQLSGNAQWATQLGNAFLAQQPDVMDAIQRLRGQAMSSGKLNSTPEQVVTRENQGDSSVVEIQPANPQVIYVPTYDPMAIWGAPAYYPYPVFGYPYYPLVRGARFIGFSAGIMVGAFFGGWGGWYGWGWHPNWFGRSIMVNNGFFSRYGYNRGFGFRAGFGGSGVWAHDPAHRLGVAYPNRQVASQFHANVNARAQSAARAQAGLHAQAALRSSSMARSQAARSMSSQSARSGARSFASAPNGYRSSGSNSFNSRAYNSGAASRAAAPRAAAPSRNYRSYSNSGASRASAAPQHYSAPSSRGSSSMGRSASSGRSSGGGGGHSSSGHSSGHRR